MILPAQLRAARSLLGWSQLKLANEAGLAVSTIKRMEGSAGPTRGTAHNVWKVERTLGEAGITLIDANGGGPGVRLALAQAPAGSDR